MSLAEFYAQLEDHDHALEYLERAYREHQAELVGIGVDPLFSPLRGREEVQNLLRRIVLPQA